MLDIKFIRENSEKVKAGVAAKGVDASLVDRVLGLDADRRLYIQKIEELQAERNKISSEREVSEATRFRGREIKEELGHLREEFDSTEVQFINALREIPNLPAEDVKEGEESDNEVIRTWGTPREFGFELRDHLELGEKLGMIDTERAAKVSGTRFAYLTGDAVFLEMALASYALETLAKEGFTPVIPPVLVRRESMLGMGYLEHGGEEDMFRLEKDDMFLVGTSEQSIGPMYMNEVLSGKDLPLRYVGYSPCFRREAGSYGKDTRGIIRLHQFDKIEMFSYSKPEESDREHEFMLQIEEKFFQSLNIPYQVVKMASGDLGAPAARKYDIEAWVPSQEKYREVTSASTTTDFQARRLNIKYEETGERQYVHMLNGTAFAVGRTLVAIIENYQQKDGSVVIPEVLRKWTGKDRIKKDDA